MEAMRHVIPAAFEARNCVLIALLALCLRPRHISVARNSDVVAYSELLKIKKASAECFFSKSHMLYLSLSVSVTMSITKIMNKENNREQETTQRCWSWTIGSLLAV